MYKTLRMLSYSGGVAVVQASLEYYPAVEHCPSSLFIVASPCNPALCPTTPLDAGDPPADVELSSFGALPLDESLQNLARTRRGAVARRRYSLR